MKKTLLFIIFLGLMTGVQTQTLITGKVADEKGLPLPGANVTLKDTYDGASCDTAGRFSFSTDEKGKQVLVVSFIGYKPAEIEVDLSEKAPVFQVELKEQQGEIREVVISAGTFETGDLKRPLVLKPMDIATTPSAMGDIYGALTTLPGAQIVGSDGGLYVRGGEGYEIKTFIDGMLVASPYSPKMPDLPTRSRFSPMLFTGTAFSTGGYSAEYGQALSSAINLSTVGMADRNQTNVSLMTVGASASHTEKWEKTSLTGSLDYYDMYPYYSLAKQRMEWHRAPYQLSGNFMFRQKTGKYGLLKIFGYTSLNRSSLYYNYQGDSAKPSLIRLQDDNYYLNAIYTNQPGEKWRIKSGLAFSHDITKTGINQDLLKDNANAISQRITMTCDLNGSISLKLGEEVNRNAFTRSYFQYDSSYTWTTSFRLMDYAVYIEPEVRIRSKLVFRAGFRAEYLDLMHEWDPVPRLSLAYKVKDYSQVSLAFGQFRQRPENQYLVYSHDLQSEKATHLILNYQYERDNLIFRIELYRKWYNQLVKYASEYNPDPNAYTNAGKGYAQGVDVFLRDSRSVKNLDYWVSYSFIDTRRDYRNFGRELMPSFVSPHTYSAVVKYFIEKTRTFLGLTAMHASGKMYYNPFITDYTGTKTRAYNDVSANITQVFPLWKSYVAVYTNLSNILGFSNVYGYHYSATPDATGEYTRYPILPQSKRFFILGAFFVMQ